MATSPAPEAPRLSAAQLAELVELAREADDVELKLSIPDAKRRDTIAALGLDPLEAQLRQVYFFDTPDLALDRRGLVVRARRIQGRGDDTVVKLRPVVPAQIPPALRKSDDMVVEVDAMPGGFVCSASLKGRPRKVQVRDVALGRAPISAVYSKKQRTFFRAHAPAGLELDDLSVLGPITVLKLKFTPEAHGRRLVAELWLNPDGSRSLELSTRASAAEAFQVAAEVQAALREHGVEVAGDQQTKTRTALDRLASDLRAGPHAEA